MNEKYLECLDTVKTFRACSIWLHDDKMWTEFRDFIYQQFKINLTDKNILQFKIYLEELIDCNKKFNLTSITEQEKILYLHFADSLAASYLIPPNKEKQFNVADIGSGAGFPGLPLKIVYPEIKLTVVESTKKKVLFIDYITRKLKLNNVEILNCRAEELAFGSAKYQNKFDFVLFRAVSSDIQKCCEIAMKLVNKTNNSAGKAVFWSSKQSIHKFNFLEYRYKVLKPHYEYMLPENRLRYLISVAF